MSKEVGLIVKGRSCNRCGEFKALSEFGPRPRGRYGVKAVCRPCCNEKVLEWLDENQDVARDRHLRRKYGISLYEYNNMLSEQDGVCAICGQEPSIANFKASKRPKRRPPNPTLVVDHSHETGLIRGLLCVKCNIGIGNFEDDPDRLIVASEYLVRGRNV